MATPVVIVTPGATNANSYCTVLEAEDYFSTHIYRSTWYETDVDTQTRALLLATRLLDERMCWYGSKTSSAQRLRFPQMGLTDLDGDVIDSATIPQCLINATAEFAQALLVADRTAENDTKGIKRMRIGTLELEVDKADRTQVIPESVLSMIKHLGTMYARTATKVVRS